MEAFCILAAGKGVRCQGVNKLHKCLLPIGNKAVISHIIDKAPAESDIIIAIGHQGQLVKEYCLAAHPDKNFVFVTVEKYEGPGAGPGYSLQCCKEHLQRPFYLVCSDCIVSEPLPDLHRNWLGVFPVSDPIHWSTAKVYDGKVINFKNKAIDGYEYAFIGVAGIKDYEIFWSQMKHTDKEYEMVSAFYDPHAYLELYAYMFSWHDTGTPENYYKSKSHLGQANLGMAKEIDEITYKVGDRCVKVFGNALVAAGRIERVQWLNGLTPTMKFAGEHVYAYEWVRGGTMYEVGTLDLFEKFLNWCEYHLWIDDENLEHGALCGVWSKNFSDLCYKFYHDKTLGRVKAYLDKKGLEHDVGEFINGTKCEPIETYLEKIDWVKLSYGKPVKFHGDLQFENILYGDGKFCLIDWRDSFADERKFGDLYYDLAKLYGGLGMCYQNIKEGKFEMTENPARYSFEMPPYLNELRTYFENRMLRMGMDLYKIKVLAALIYLNMAPLHTPNFDRLLFCHAKHELEILL